MNTDDPKSPEHTTPDAQWVADLIRSAGRRAAPPEASRRRTLELATDAWRVKTASVRRRRRVVTSLVALAAGVLTLVALLPFLARTVDAPGVAVATVQQVSGGLDVQLSGSSTWHVVTTNGRSLPAGSRVRTGPGSRAGLTLAGGSSLRLAEGTHLGLDSKTRVTLVTGRAYVDSGTRGPSGTPLAIVTPTATAREVGTQFEVALLGDQYRLRVREGSVVVDYGERETRAEAGEQIYIEPGRQPARTSIPRTDPEWQWVETVAPVPDLDDRPVSELLEWVARETGREVRYADEQAARRAATTILHGHLHGLAPLEALDVMLATTELEYVAEPDGTLLIERKPSD